jgi:class 3 adenylate cyclase
MAESVELATILLTDLVGSTRLATSVGPARADQLRDEHFELLRVAITSCGGREVKNTGDGVMVAFVSASAAVKCAVAMQQLFERRYREAEQGLHVRIGVAAGESTVKEGDYFGMPSTEAARLCAQAPADGILVSGLTTTLAGHCDGVEFTSIGKLELKGFPEPVEALSVSWAPLAEEAGAAGRWPLPAVLRSVPPVSYVGRVTERDTLERTLVQARSGQRRVALLSGEPGIGKTRLASFCAHRAHAQGMAVCWGACSEELAVPYEPWIEVCSQLVEHAPLELLEHHVKRHKGELGRLARNLDQRVAGLPEPQTSDPETERYLLFSAVAGFLHEASERTALCLVLDDLHWADGQSVALLKHLVRMVEQGALEVIATYRDSDLGKDHPLTGVLADLRPVEGVQRIPLHGLDAHEVAEILTVVAGHELEEDGVELASQIAAETDGNPFFVGEILRGLSESGALSFDQGTGRWSVDSTSDIALPESVRDVIERRVERLGDEAAESLRHAAVIGRSFDVELLGTVLGVDDARLLDQLEAAVAASILAEVPDEIGGFRFAHALINQTLYECLGATRRARMHQRVAEALEESGDAETGDRLSELALHWRLAAASVDKAKAARYARMAGRKALESLAPAEAARLFTDAVELTGLDSPERCEALIGLGEAQRQTGEAGYRETLLDAARISSSLGDAELAARAAIENNRGYSSVIGAVDEERLRAIERGLELDVPPKPQRRARLLALQAQELGWDPDFARRCALADEAISLARGEGDARTLAEVLRPAFFAYWSAETLELRARLSDEMLEYAAAANDPALQVWAHDIEFHIYTEKGDFVRARTALERQQRIAEELGQPTLKWFATFPSAGYALMRGDLAAAERLAELGFQIGQESGEPDAVLLYGAQLSKLRVCQGRGDEVVGMLEQSVSAYPGIAAWRAGLAWALCWLDRGAEADAIVKEAARDRFEHIAPGRAKLTALALYADAAVQTRNREVASCLYELIEPWSDQFVWNAAVGCGHARTWLGLLAGLLGDDDLADEHLAFACDFHEANDLPLWAARTRLGWAEILCERGEPGRAREHAERSLELSREHGYGVFEARSAAIADSRITT